MIFKKIRERRRRIEAKIDKNVSPETQYLVERDTYDPMMLLILIMAGLAISTVAAVAVPMNEANALTLKHLAEETLGLSSAEFSAIYEANYDFGVAQQVSTAIIIWTVGMLGVWTYSIWAHGRRMRKLRTKILGGSK